jgi:hypothetical protein
MDHVSRLGENGAGDEIRTHDIHLGKIESADFYLILSCRSFEKVVAFQWWLHHPLVVIVPACQSFSLVW